MALTVTNNMTAYGTGDTGESIDVATGAGWYDLDNLHADFGRCSLINTITADYYEGASGVEGCVGISHASSATVVGFVYHDGTGALDLSGTCYVRCTAKFGETAGMGSKVQGGVRIIVMDSSNNYAEWYVDGKESYSGDWEQYLVDVSTTPDNTSTTSPTMTDIDYIGISSYYTIKPARAENVYIDAQWYGTDPSITVTGTVATADDGWSELESISQAVTRRDGVIRSRNGIYEMRGTVKFGSTATASVDFSDAQNSKLRFPAAPVGSLDSASGFLLQGNATGTVDFSLGSIVGGAGLLGGSIFADSVAYTFDSATNTATIDTCDLQGVSFENSGVIEMDGASTQTMVSCQLVACAQFDPGAAVIEQTKFIATTDTGGAVLWNDNIDLTDCQFIANTIGAGIEHTTIESVYTGTADDPGSSTTVLYDAGATFVGNVAVGEYIYNEPDGCYAKITAITDTNTLAHEALTGGTADDWTNGDAYSISPLQGYDNLIFSGNTDDVLNSATGSDGLFVSKVNGSNPATFDSGGSNVEFIGAVSVTVEVLDDSTGTGINLAHVLLYLASDYSTVILSGATNTSGIITTTYAGATPVDVTGWARQMDIIGTDYEQKDIAGEITSSGLSIQVRLKPIV